MKYEAVVTTTPQTKESQEQEVAARPRRSSSPAGLKTVALSVDPPSKPLSVEVPSKPPQSPDSEVRIVVKDVVAQASNM